MARILVAEDDGPVADVVQTMLRSGGYEVVLAKNGDEAIRIFREQDFDLVLCDVHMPGKDGLEVTEEDPSIVTGYPHSVDDRQLSAGHWWSSPRSSLLECKQESRCHESAC